MLFAFSDLSCLRCLYGLQFRNPSCVLACLFGHPAANTMEVRTQNWARGICQFGSDISAVAIAVRRIKSVAMLAQVVVASFSYTADRVSRILLQPCRHRHRHARFGGPPCSSRVRLNGGGSTLPSDCSTRPYHTCTAWQELRLS